MKHKKEWVELSLHPHTSSWRRVWRNSSEPIWYCSLGNDSQSNVILPGPSALQHLLLHAEYTMHIYLQTAVYLVKRHPQYLWMNGDTRIRHKYRQIFLLLASGAVPELPNGQWEGARDSGDVMCADFNACNAQTARQTQFTVQRTTRLVRLDANIPAEGQHSQFCLQTYV